MANYRRVYVPGGAYFFTVVVFERRPFLTTDLAHRCLHEAWKTVQTEQPFQVEAVCLLPNHLHCIWSLPKDDADYSQRWNMIKGVFSKRYLAAGGQDGARNASRQRTGGAALWQRRFWEHYVRDEENFQQHIDYIHFNPVKRGYVVRPAD